MRLGFSRLEKILTKMIFILVEKKFLVRLDGRRNKMSIMESAPFFSSIERLAEEKSLTFYIGWTMNRGKIFHLSSRLGLLIERIGVTEQLFTLMVYIAMRNLDFIIIFNHKKICIGF